MRTDLRILSAVALILGALALASCRPASETGDPVSVTAAPFVVEEATIAEIHAALAAGHTTCVEIVQAHLDRIGAYDKQRPFDSAGSASVAQDRPALNALITINPRALEIAAEQDRLRAAGGTLRPLHCIPVIVKDNYDTADLPTTGGSLALAQSIPPDDAFVIKRLREAGAIVIAKANLTELARGGTTVSALGGQTRNPYDVTRTPGGSSGGTGAAIAASFGVIGTGSDTGQSTRSPASANSLVGLRPTRGLISRDGIIPISSTQDEAGPIARTVEDAARMLDVMVGYDPADPITAFGHGRTPKTYTAFLDAAALKGARIGVLTDFFGDQPVHEPVNRVMDAAMAQMTRQGAALVRISIPNLVDLTADMALGEFESDTAFNHYLASLGANAPVKSFKELIAKGGFHPAIAADLKASEARAAGIDSDEYRRRVLRREDLRCAVMRVIAAERLDAILYPHQRRLVALIGDEQLERNGVLSNGTGFPAITIPAGFSESTTSAPDGVPIGLELLGPEWSEPTLVRLAFAFEQTTRIRKPPASTPRLR
jgi:amidase